MSTPGIAAFPEASPCPGISCAVAPPEVARALIQGHRICEDAITQAAGTGPSPFLSVGVDLIQPALYEVGRLWEIGEVTVAQEHLATAICETALANLYAAADFAPSHGRRIVLACVAGNRHSVGLRILADSFEIAGWQTEYLGADVPVDDWLAHVDTVRPDVVALSAALPSHLGTLRLQAERLRGDLAGARPSLVVGGLAPNALAGALKRTSVDGWFSNARRALAAIR